MSYPRFETHSHSAYSSLRMIDAINTPKGLVDRAIQLGLKGLALTDHECLSGAVEFNQIQQEVENFKCVIGNEIYLTNTRESNQKYYHCILLAKDKEGFRQLRILSSYAWLNSYADRGVERVPTLKSELKDVIRMNPGHLICTSACIGGELGTNILRLNAARVSGDEQGELDSYNNICNYITYMKNLFGNDFYIEIAPSQYEDQIIVNKKLIQIAKNFDVKVVIGTDAHYLKKEDRFAHEAFLNSKDNGDREVASFYTYAYLQSEEDIIENLTPSFGEDTELLYKEFCNNSIEIFDKCEIYSLAHSQQIPKVEVKNYPKTNTLYEERDNYPILYSMTQSDDKVERYWINECLQKLKTLNKDNKEYLSRLEEEADTKKVIGDILQTNMFAYPVTLQHYVDLFWKCGSMVGAGRGSSCSGLNHYLLGITQLDPIKWNLPFWRYLNKERTELGDIDLDLCPSKRPLIIDKIKEERGRSIRIEDVPLYMEDFFKEKLGCTLIATFGTESTKSAILTSCRGYRSEEYPNGIDVDTAQYLSSLVPQERGFIWPLKDIVNGNEEKGRSPVTLFVNEVKQYPGLLDIMFGIEGTISRRGSHASGVILFDEDPFEFGCFMKTPSGDVITQYDLHKAEAAGMTKYDFLVTEVQDKLVQTIKLLQEYGEIEKDLTLKEVYDKYLHPEVLPIDDQLYWEPIQKVQVLDLFQFDSLVGSRAAKRISPHNMLELADANGLMRLMTGEQGGEQPMDKYVRFKNNINLWYKEMDKYGLTKEEQESLKPHFLRSYGVPPSQEQLMTMLMDENICSFSLKDANAARKIVGKKQMNKIPQLHQQVMDQAKSAALGKYVWDCGVGPQMGYSFSVIHALAYSFIGFQTAFISTKWNPIYWNTACLIVNSGSLEADAGGTDYTKIAKAIGSIMSNGIKLSLVDINQSDFGFKPDIKNNQILFGMKGLANVGDDIVLRIIDNRPYKSVEDFMQRVAPSKQVMISLIKGGAFDQFMDRIECMKMFIWETCDKKKRLTLQNMGSLIAHGLVPTDSESMLEAVRVFEFNRYLKTFKFNVDERAINFLVEIGLDDLTDGKTIDKSKWEKEYQKRMDTLRAWLNANKEETLEKLNNMLFMEEWNKYAVGSVSDWEMDALCFYYHEHPLNAVNQGIYGFVNFFDLPEEPVVDRSFTKNNKEIKIFKLFKICGTCVAKDKSKHTISLLTPGGVVTVKFNKDYFAMFDKRISEKNADGTKSVKEKSWFDRGNKLVVQGIRNGDQFMSKNYSSLHTHQLYKIMNIDNNDGTITLVHERYKGIEEDEEV